MLLLRWHSHILYKEMMMHTTLAQLRSLKLDGLAAGLEEQLAQPGMGALSFEERVALLVERELHCRTTASCCA